MPSLFFSTRLFSKHGESRVDIPARTDPRVSAASVARPLVAPHFHRMEHSDSDLGRARSSSLAGCAGRVVLLLLRESRRIVHPAHARSTSRFSLRMGCRARSRPFRVRAAPTHMDDRLLRLRRHRARRRGACCETFLRDTPACSRGHSLSKSNAASAAGNVAVGRGRNYSRHRRF